MTCIRLRRPEGGCVRGAAVPIEIRDTPYFLISYPHTPRNGEGSERDPDLLVSKFCDDLSRCVEELTWRPERTHVGILDRAVWFGDDWETGLPEALCTCRVLVPLYSPRYFQSIHCGKEWSAFADQPSIPGTTARQAPPIVPAIWEPVDLKSVDSAAVRAVPVEYFGLESYEAHGIEGIINLAAYRADYTAVVRELARRIVAAAQGLPASPRRVIDYATLPSAFDPEADLRSADPRLRVTVVARDAVEAEVTAKALFLAGSHAARREADELSIPAVLVTESGRTITAGGLA